MPRHARVFIVVAALTVLLLAPAGLATALEAAPAPDASEATRVTPDDRVILVHARDADAATVDRALRAAGFTSITLERLGMSLVRADGEARERLAAFPGIASAHADEPVEFFLSEVAPMVNATTVWEPLGFTGAGVTAMVIDSGVDAAHPDLHDRIVENVQPVVPLDHEDGDYPYVEAAPPNDWFGHGTHVAGIIAGTGEALGEADPSHGKYVGVAPGTELVTWAIPPVGYRTPVGLTSTVLQGMEYALANQDRFGIRVSSNSWGTGGGRPDPESPLNVASRELYRAGIPVVFSAGNAGKPSGPDEHLVNPLSTVPWTLSVANLRKDLEISDLSSRGSDPREGGRIWDHPSVAAPGHGTFSAKSRASAYGALGFLMGPDSTVWTALEGDVAGRAHYQYGSGTSMSAPVVTGVIALMLEANPDLSPDQVYDIIVSTATPVDGYAYWDVGAGLVDARAAVEAALATEGNLDAFLAGERAYDADPEDPLGDPLRRFLVASGPGDARAAPLVEHLAAEGVLSAGAAGVDDRSVPALGGLVAGVLLAVTGRFAAARRGA